MSQMGKEFGKRFKQLRKAKGLSQVEISDSFISTSSLSRFENGEQDISLKVAVHLLNKLSMRLDEFYIYTKNVPKSIGEEIEEIGGAYKKEDIEELEKLKKYYQQNQYVTFRNSHYRILCEGYIADIKGEEISEQDINVIKEYLFNVKQWQYYEVTLFGNIFHIFQLDTIEFLSKNALRTFLKYKSLSKYKDEYALILINIAGHFLDKNHFSGAVYQLQKAKEYLLNNPEYIYGQIRLFYTKGYYYFKSGKNQRKGISMMQKAIYEMKKFHLESESNRHERFLQFIQRE